MADLTPEQRAEIIRAKDDGFIFQGKGVVVRKNVREKVAFLTVNGDRAGYLSVTCFKAAIDCAEECNEGDEVFITGKIQSQKNREELKNKAGFDIWDTVLQCDKPFDIYPAYPARRRASAPRRAQDNASGPPADDVPPPGDDDIPY